MDFNEWNKKVIKEFRENDGQVGGTFENATLLLLHTTGAKSGKERINPLMCVPEEDRFIIIASKAGAPSHPDWYHNIVANPEVGVEFGAEEFKAKANILDEPERTQVYDKVANMYPNFAEYREKTDRTIPVISLKRLS